MKHRGKTNTYLVEFLEGDNKENDMIIAITPTLRLPQDPVVKNPP